MQQRTWRMGTRGSGAVPRHGALIPVPASSSRAWRPMHCQPHAVPMRGVLPPSPPRHVRRRRRLAAAAAGSDPPADAPHLQQQELQQQRPVLVQPPTSSGADAGGDLTGDPTPTAAASASPDATVAAISRLTEGHAAGAPSSSSSSSSGSSTSGEGAPSRDAAPSPPDVPSTSGGSGVGAAPADAPPGASQPPPWLQALLARLAAPFALLAAAVAAASAQLQRLPAWARAQRVRRLREGADEAPGDADKQAALLAALNAAHPKEVLARVESRKYASNGAVVVEYLRALVTTGRLQAFAAAPAGAAPGAGESHRSLAQLLRELQSQAEGAAPDEAPGASVRRPLHVTLQAAGAAPLAGRPTGPLQVVWALLSSVLLVVALAFAWLVGSQAVRRAQAQQAAVAAGSGVAGVGGGALGGSPSVEPKEYKKEELSERSVKTFKDVLGCDESKAELQEIVEFLRNPTRFTRLGAKLPKGVLLTGPPGTGKTLLARAVAGEAGVPFFYRAGSEFEELYVGVGSRRMRALFAAAKKKAPCIVFIDEIDAIGGNRKHWENHTRKTLNQLLVEMDGFEANEGVIVMAATNLPETLDPALKRPGRFDRQVAVPLPDVRGRTQILAHYLLDKPAAADVDAARIARQTPGMSGADLANLVNEAALLAAKTGAERIDASMVDYAYDKIRMGVERRSAVRTPESLRRTAYHESGHALVALHTPGASPLHKATIVPRGHALGMVTQVGREDEFSISRQQMLARIRVCMGGTVAEELIFGRDQVTSGATDDLRQATEMARHMVLQCGLSDAVGPLYVESEKELGEELRRTVDAEVRGMLVDARDAVKALLTEKNADLHALAGALLSHETLTASDIAAVLRGEVLVAPEAAAIAAAAAAASAPAPADAAVAAALEEQ